MASYSNYDLARDGKHIGAVLAADQTKLLIPI
jgi:hypothetical protein